MSVCLAGERPLAVARKAPWAQILKFLVWALQRLVGEDWDQRNNAVRHVNVFGARRLYSVDQCFKTKGQLKPFVVECYSFNRCWWSASHLPVLGGCAMSRQARA